MSIHITDVDGDLGSVIKFSEAISEAEFAEIIHGHLSQAPEKYKRYRFCLADLREVTELNLSPAAIQANSRACVRSAAINPSVVVAVVAPTDLEFGLARMWEIMSSETPWEICVFRENKEARAWIRSRAREKWDIIDLTMEPTAVYSPDVLLTT